MVKQQAQKTPATPQSVSSVLIPLLQPRAFGESESVTSQNSQSTMLEHTGLPAIGHSLGRMNSGMLSRLPIQPKLTIGKVGDPYEQEADRVAAQVVNRLHAPRSADSPQLQSKTALRRKPLERSVQRSGAKEEEELQMKPLANSIQRSEQEEEEVQMKPAIQRRSDPGGTAASTDLESSINQMRGSGQSMSDSVRQPMEQAFGADFGQVRIHADSRANQLSRSINAKAFTTKNDIFFSEGAYQPGDRGGQELLAHELTHVVQQGGAGAQNQIARVPGMGSKPSSPQMGQVGGDSSPEPEFDFSDDESKWDKSTNSQQSKLKRQDALPMPQNAYDGDVSEDMLKDFEKMPEQKKPSFMAKLSNKLKGTDKGEIVGAFKGRHDDIKTIKESAGDIHTALQSAKGVKDADINADSLLYKILGTACAEVIQKIGAVVSAVIVAGKSIFSWIGRYKEMKALQDSLKSNKDEGLQEALGYSYDKVKRSVWEGFADVVINVTQSICRVITVLSGGTAAVVTSIIDAAGTIAKTVKTLIHAGKGFYKWVIGTRGVNRKLGAGEIVGYAASGNPDAIKVIHTFKPFKFLDAYHAGGDQAKTLKEKGKAALKAKTQGVLNAGKRALGKNVSDYLDPRQFNLSAMQELLPAIMDAEPGYSPYMVNELTASLTSKSTV
jgi:hypothetical protein